jgi:hypothetical protein
VCVYDRVSRAFIFYFIFFLDAVFLFLRVSDRGEKQKNKFDSMGEVIGTGFRCKHCKAGTEFFMKLVTKDFTKHFSVCGPVCEACFAKVPVQVGLSKIRYTPRANESEAYYLEQEADDDDDGDYDDESDSDSDSDSDDDFFRGFDRFVEPTEPSELTSDLWLNWRRTQRARMGLDSKLEPHPIRFPHRNSP